MNEEPTVIAEQQDRKGGNRDKALMKSKRVQALELRLGGASYSQIARTVGYYSESGAYRAVMYELSKTAQEPADSLRKIMLRRTEKLYMAVANEANKGSLPHVKEARNIIARICSMTGLDTIRVSPVMPDGSAFQLVVRQEVIESTLRQMAPEELAQLESLANRFTAIATSEEKPSGN